jgi:hypothetical protein
MSNAVSRTALIWQLLPAACIVLLTVIAGLAAVYLSKPSSQFRLLGDRSQLANALAFEVANGDSLVDVERLLGPGDHRKSKRWVEIQIDNALTTEFSRQYPQGILIDDVFVAYRGSFQIVLQFRDGQLVNHRQELFQRLAD